MVGEQHSVRALQELRSLRRQGSLDTTAPWLNVVRATRVIRFGTPVERVQLMAGDHQASQSGVVNIRVSQFLRLALFEPADTPIGTRVLRAVQKAGWTRGEKPVCDTQNSKPNAILIPYLTGRHREEVEIAGGLRHRVW